MNIFDILKDSGKHVINNSVDVGETAARQAAGKAISSVTKKWESAHTGFIDIRDFYNFIKEPGGRNAPTDFWYFSVSFFKHNDENDGTFSMQKGDFLSSKETPFFEAKAAELARLRFCVQKIIFPDIELKAAGVSGTENLGNGVIDTSTIFGGYNVLANSWIHAKQHTIDMSILNTQVPVIENLIYPWMVEAVNSTKTEGQSLIPKLNMAVKYWGRK